MEKEEFIKCLDKAIDLLMNECYALGNEEDSQYKQEKLAEKRGGIEALSALKYVLNNESKRM